MNIINYFRKKWKQISVSAVSAALCLAFVACGPTDPTDVTQGGGSQSGETQVEFWSTYATEKVMQDVEYTGTKFEPKLEVYAARGEYESGQIIMTAGTDVHSYDVQITDLKTSDGKVFPKENIILYNQKYIEVNQNYENNGAPLGMYPDAILPFEAAKNFGENKIEAGERKIRRRSSRASATCLRSSLAITVMNMLRMWIRSCRVCRICSYNTTSIRRIRRNCGGTPASDPARLSPPITRKIRSYPPAR